MSVRTIILVVLAIVCGIAAAAGVSFLRVPTTSIQKTVNVVVAARNLPRGINIDDDAVALRPWPESLVPAGAVTDKDQAVGRGLLYSLVKNEPLLNSKLANKDAGRGMAARVPKGMRAFTINTPNTSAAGGGFILPGNKVDVLLTTTSSDRNDGTGGGVTTTLLQNVEVLAVAQRDDMPADNKLDPREATNVMLLVTPDQAAKLNLGMNRGILHLALRNSEDMAEAQAQLATMADLRFHQEGPVEDAVADNQTVAAPEMMTGTEHRFYQIHTLRGLNRGEVRFELNP